MRVRRFTFTILTFEFRRALLVRNAGFLKLTARITFLIPAHHCILAFLIPQTKLVSHFSKMARLTYRIAVKKGSTLRTQARVFYLLQLGALAFVAIGPFSVAISVDCARYGRLR